MDLNLTTENFSTEKKTPPMEKQGFNRFIYHFGPDKTEGSSAMRDLLGGKGANLAEMSRLGFPVPPGFTLSTELCKLFYNQNKTLPQEFFNELEKAVSQLEKLLNKKFGDPKNPLIVSVRSGAPSSMPGMMDTILNLGLNEKTLQGLIAQTNNPRFAWDTYRRFIQMYSDVVMGMNPSLFEVHLDDYKNQKGYTSDSEIKEEDWKKIITYFKEIILQDTGQVFPEDPKEQLYSAILAVFKSWNNPRACIYRKMNGGQSSLGTAVNIQAMVFGNRGDDCATGVVFTRHPSTGEKTLFGEFLVNSQGEDVVAGIRTPLPITNKSQPAKSLKNLMPQAYKQLANLCDQLEKHYRYIQDIEFTIEQNKLWLLQTRSGKCSAKAQLKIVCDLMEEGLLDEKQALLLVDSSSLETLLHPSIDPKETKVTLAKGLPASPGGAVGRIVLSNEEAISESKKGNKVILVRTETSPEDINGMINAQGILTSRGGMTSHAAVVARSMGKPCIVGCESLQIDKKKKELKFYQHKLKEGDEISIDGSTGEVLKGIMKTKPASLDKNFFKIMSLADKYAKLEVRANADTPTDVQKSKDFGAKGVGLCRTEHMFFAPDRINIMRKMIMSEDMEERKVYLDQLFSIQKEDFQALLEIMDGQTVTIRFLDPPLHEFLPHTNGELNELAQKYDWSVAKLTSKINQLKETNPMLGHRGCRLAITYPEIYLMQAKAVASAIKTLREKKLNPQAEIMIPLVILPEELKLLKRAIQKELGDLEIPIGTMIELPAACLRAREIAEQADFISFGTNDLTQTTLGISRDDSSKFLASYINQELFEHNPFAQLDEKSVGKLIEIALENCKNIKIKKGICGEHGGNPKSIQFFHKLKLSYVSCSPFRIPVARLAVAQAQLKESN